MSPPNPVGRFSAAKRAINRSLVIVFAWVTSLAIATMGFATLDLRHRFEEGVAFGCSFAIAVTISPLLPLVLGGRRRWAMQSAGAIGVFVVSLVLLSVLLLWVTPWLTMRVVSLRILLIIREILWNVAGEVATSWGPLAATIGIMVGVIGGIVAFLARFRPRLGAAVAAGLVLFFAVGVGNQAIFGTGMDLVLEWRKDHGRWRSNVSQVTNWELASALGATTGAFVGVSAAGLAIWRSRNARVTDSRKSE